jgi:hypothetical protein
VRNSDWRRSNQSSPSFFLGQEAEQLLKRVRGRVRGRVQQEKQKSRPHNTLANQYRRAPRGPTLSESCLASCPKKTTAAESMGSDSGSFLGQYSRRAYGVVKGSGTRCSAMPAWNYLTRYAGQSQATKEGSLVPRGTFGDLRNARRIITGHRR